MIRKRNTFGVATIRRQGKPLFLDWPGRALLSSVLALSLSVTSLSACSPQKRSGGVDSRKTPALLAAPIVQGLGWILTTVVTTSVLNKFVGDRSANVSNEIADLNRQIQENSLELQRQGLTLDRANQLLSIRGQLFTELTAALQKDQVLLQRFQAELARASFDLDLYSTELAKYNATLALYGYKLDGQKIIIDYTALGLQRENTTVSQETLELSRLGFYLNPGQNIAALLGLSADPRVLQATERQLRWAVDGLLRAGSNAPVGDALTAALRATLVYGQALFQDVGKVPCFTLAATDYVGNRYSTNRAEVRAAFEDGDFQAELLNMGIDQANQYFDQFQGTRNTVCQMIDRNNQRIQERNPDASTSCTTVQLEPFQPSLPVRCTTATLSFRGGNPGTSSPTLTFAAKSQMSASQVTNLVGGLCESARQYFAARILGNQQVCQDIKLPPCEVRNDTSCDSIPDTLQAPTEQDLRNVRLDEVIASPLIDFVPLQPPPAVSVSPSNPILPEQQNPLPVMPNAPIVPEAGAVPNFDVAAARRAAPVVPEESPEIDRIYSDIEQTPRVQPSELSEQEKMAQQQAEAAQQSIATQAQRGERPICANDRGAAVAVAIAEVLNAEPASGQPQTYFNSLKNSMGMFASNEELQLLRRLRENASKALVDRKLVPGPQACVDGLNAARSGPTCLCLNYTVQESRSTSRTVGQNGSGGTPQAAGKIVFRCRAMVPPMGSDGKPLPEDKIDPAQRDLVSQMYSIEIDFFTNTTASKPAIGRNSPECPGPAQ